MYYDNWDWSQNQKDSGYKAIPSYLIFDETARTAGPLWSSKNPDPAAILPAALGGPTTMWSKDNQAEIDKGIIKKRGTPSRNWPRQSAMTWMPPCSKPR